MPVSTKVKIWTAIITAIAAAVIASLPLFCSGCAIAVDGRLAVWAALPGKEPPDLPPWAPVRELEPTTKPARP